MDRQSAINMIRNSALAADAEMLIADLLPSFGIRARRATRELGLGESRLGGSPDLPPGFEWPRCLGATVEWDQKQQRAVRATTKEVYLQFVAQIRLEDLPEIEGKSLLSRQGSLCFFYDVEHQPWGYDPADRSGWRVIHLSGPSSELMRTEHPQPNSQFESQLCQVNFDVEWTLPDYGVTVSHGKDSDWCDEVKEILVDINGWDGFGVDMHRLLGHAQHIQNDDLQGMCQLNSHGVNCADAWNNREPRVQELMRGAKVWRLLLQIDTDEEGPGWMWGDCGRIYYWVMDADLKSGNFDGVWLVQQCY